MTEIMQVWAVAITYGLYILWLDIGTPIKPSAPLLIGVLACQLLNQMIISKHFTQGDHYRW